MCQQVFSRKKELDENDEEVWGSLAPHILSAGDDAVTGWKLMLQLAMHYGILKAKMFSLACERWRRQQTSNQLWIKEQRTGIQHCPSPFWTLSLLTFACQSPWLHRQAPNSL
jgi:hypothetical protein